MSITTTLGVIATSRQALAELATYKPKGKLGYDVGKLIRLANHEIEEFDRLQQLSVESNGTFTPADGSYRFLSLAAQQGLKHEVEELKAKEVVLEVSLLPYADIEKLEPTAGFWAQLHWAITPPE